MCWACLGGLLRVCCFVGLSVDLAVLGGLVHSLVVCCLILWLLLWELYWGLCDSCLRLWNLMRVVLVILGLGFVCLGVHMMFMCRGVAYKV